MVSYHDPFHRLTDKTGIGCFQVGTRVVILLAVASCGLTICIEYIITVLDEHTIAHVLVGTVVGSSKCLGDSTVIGHDEVIKSLCNSRTLHRCEGDVYRLCKLVARAVLHVVGRHRKGVLFAIVQHTVVEAHTATAPYWLQFLAIKHRLSCSLYSHNALIKRNGNLSCCTNTCSMISRNRCSNHGRLIISFNNSLTKYKDITHATLRMVAIIQSIKLFIERIVGVIDLVADTGDTNYNTLLPHRFTRQHQFYGVDGISCYIPSFLQFRKFCTINRDKRLIFLGGSILGTHICRKGSCCKPLCRKLILEGDIAGAITVLVETIDSTDNHTLTITYYWSATILRIAQRAVTHLHHTALGITLSVPCFIGSKRIAGCGGISIALVTAGIKHSNEILYFVVGHQLHIAVNGQFALFQSISILLIISP